MKNTTIFKTSNSGKNLRFWHFCLLLYACCSVTGGYSQGTIGIGSGTASESYLMPVYTNYGYNYTQQIVTAAQYSASGGVAGNITKIRYYVNNASTPLANWNNWTVYIGHTSKTAFSSTTDWEPLTNLTQVYTGTVTPVSASWMEITFTTPFAYNGTSNLVVAIDENSNLYSDGDTYWGSYAGATNNAMYYRSDTVNPNPASPPTATGRTATLARIQFVGALATCLAPSGLAASAITTTGATVNWTASASNPGSGYEYYHSTTNTAPTASTSPTGNVTTGASTTFSALSPNTPYYVWVRANCGAGDVSGWSSSVTFTTQCDAQAVPYTQNFESVTTPALPECTGIQNVGTGNVWNTVSAPGYGFTTKTLRYPYNSANAANVWFYTKGLTLTAGTSYRLIYKYGNSGATTYVEKMKVAYGMSTAATSMTNPLADHPNIINNVTPITNIVDFIPQTTGTYYIGFNAYSAADKDQLYLDDISVTVTPACIAPTALTLGTKTETSIAFSWAASTVAPAMGYEYYYGTANTAPTGTSTPSGSVGPGIVTATIGTLTPSTTYYIWVRGKCDTNLYSDWTGPLAVTTLCDAPEITGTTPGSVCGQGSVALQATASSGGLLTWYTAATGGSIVGTGTTLNTPVITATTNYYVEANSLPSYVVGATYNGTVNNGGSTGSHGIMITTTVPNVTINSVAVPFTGTGTMTIAVKNTANSAVITSMVTGTVTGLGTTPLSIPVNLTIATPGSYLLIMNGITGTVGGLGYTSGNTYPFTTADGSFSVTNGYWYGSVTDNLYFFNLNVTQGCISPRQMVTATVTTAPVITASAADTTICAGESVALSVTSANAGYSYSWMPGNLTGAAPTVSPTATTTYTVTGTDTVSGCVTTATVTVTVNPLPAQVTITSSGTEVCLGQSMLLTGTGGIVPSGTTYCTPTIVGYPGITGDYIQNFTFGNITNNASGEAASDYTYYNNLTANVVANGTTTYNVSIMAGGASATYAQQFRIWIDFNQNGVFEASESVWSTTTASFSPTAMTGTVTIPTTAFNGVTRMRVASRYNTVVAGNESCVIGSTATSAWGEFEDYNVSITGGVNQVNYVWSPTTGLFTDAAGTVAYTGTAVQSVYAKPTAAIVYTATVTTASGCSASDDISLTMSTVAAPAADAMQTLCAGATVADLEATGTINWYTAATGGNALAATTTLVDGMTYYASQVVNGCESQARTASMADLINTPAPTVSDDTQVFCNAGTVSEIAVTGSAIQWYTTATGGNPIAGTTALTPGTVVYYASQTINGCESTSRAAVAVTLNSTAAPTATATQTFCNSGTVAGLMATGSGVQWYSAATGGTALAPTTALTNEGVYYASQTVSGCESATRAMVTVSISMPAAPEAAASQTFCNSGTVAGLMATGSGVKWYDAATGGTALASSAALTNGGMYYASQTIDGCESATRTMVTVTFTTPAAPQAAASQSFCSSATLDELEAIGTDGASISWYTTATGGASLASPFMLTNGGVYYASQTVDGCESSARTMVTVTINMTPAPVVAVALQSFCNSATVADLEATGTGVQWYTTQTGGTAMAADGELEDGLLYYASQAVDGCESMGRAVVAVSINTVAQVTGDAEQTITVGNTGDATIEDLVVNGNGYIMWYLTEQDALDGTNGIEAGTALVSGTTYYAMQMIGECVSMTPFAVTADVALGGEHFDMASFRYYPNPVNDVLNVSYSSDITSVAVFNMLGQQVLYQKPGATEAKIDMSGLADGAYVMKVVAGNAVKTIKIMKKQ